MRSIAVRKSSVSARLARAADLRGMAQRLDPFLRRFDQQVGQVSATRPSGLPWSRCQIEEEGRVLKRVRRVVRRFQQRAEHRVIRTAANGVARRRNQLVRVMLKPAGAPGAFPGAVLLRLQPVADQAGDFEDQSGMIGRQTQELSLLVAEMRRQSHPDAVMDQPVRLGRQAAPPSRS